MWSPYWRGESEGGGVWDLGGGGGRVRATEPPPVRDELVMSCWLLLECCPAFSRSSVESTFE